MIFVGMMIFTLLLLSCAFGVIYQLYKAIRSFIAKKFWPGLWALLFSFLLGILLLAMIPCPGFGVREKARRATCGNTIKNFALYMRMYADDHDGKYPVTFNDMAGDYLKEGDLRIFICPSSRHQVELSTNIHSWTDYAYVTGLTETDSPACVLMFCLPNNHKGDGALVGFLGGQVQWYSCKSYKDSTGKFEPTFQELTNTPSLFYGTTNEMVLADLQKRTRIIYPKKVK